MITAFEIWPDMINVILPPDCNTLPTSCVLLDSVASPNMLDASRSSIKSATCRNVVVLPVKATVPPESLCVILTAVYQTPDGVTSPSALITSANCVGLCLMRSSCSALACNCVTSSRKSSTYFTCACSSATFEVSC